MLINLVLFKSLALFLICISDLQELFAKDTWLKNLVNYIKNDIRVYQTVLLNAETRQKQGSITKDIIKEIASSLPTKIIDYKNLTSISVFNLVKPSNLNQFRTTTLFITVQAVDYNQLSSTASEIIHILNQISGKKSKAKALAIILSKEKLPSCGGLLQRMWLNDFLDFTVFEVVQAQRTSDLDVLSHKWKTISLHHYNPFRNSYTKRNYSAKHLIFPNKLQDLNGYKMKVSSFHYPPTVFLKRNNSGFPIEVTGPDAKITKTLSKAMHFKINEIYSRWSDWGHYDPDSRKTTGVLQELANKKFQLATNLLDCIPGAENLLELSRVVHHFCYVSVVPVVKNSAFLVEFSQHLFYMGLLILNLIALPVIVSHILKFEQQYWSPLYVFEAALGFVIPREPKRLAERIIFIVTLYAFLISSSSIIAVLTNFTLTTEVELDINSLEDLRDANWTLVTNEALSDLLRKTEGDEVLEPLTKKMLVSSFESCIRYVANYGNITCFMRDLRAHFYVNHVKNKNVIIKVGKPCLRPALLCIALRPGSAYLQRINQLLGRLTQAGLIYKWNEYNFVQRSRNPGFEDLIEKSFITIPIVTVLVIGFLSSTVVFVCEFIVYFHTKKNCKASQFSENHSRAI